MKYVGASGNGLCVSFNSGVSGQSATLQACDSIVEGFVYKDRLLRVTDSTKYGNTGSVCVQAGYCSSSCCFLKLATCIAGNPNQQFTRQKYDGSYAWTNVGKSLMIDVNNMANTIGNTVWLCPKELTDAKKFDIVGTSTSTSKTATPMLGVTCGPYKSKTNSCDKITMNCARSTSSCVVSRGDYRNNEGATLTVGCTGTIRFTRLDTESTYDCLKLQSQTDDGHGPDRQNKYKTVCGTGLLYSAPGHGTNKPWVVKKGTKIYWETDNGNTRSGWAFTLSCPPKKVAGACPWTLLFRSNQNTAFQNTWSGWYNSGHTVSMSSGTPSIPLAYGKLPAYDNTEISVLRWEMTNGWYMNAKMPRKQTLLSLVQSTGLSSLTVNEDTSDLDNPMRNGYKRLPSISRTTIFSNYLTIGEGDGVGGGSNLGDWCLFTPTMSHGLRNWEGSADANRACIGGETRTINGVSGVTAALRGCSCEISQCDTGAWIGPVAPPTGQGITISTGPGEISTPMESESSSSGAGVGIFVFFLFICCGAVSYHACCKPSDWHGLLGHQTNTVYPNAFNSNSSYPGQSSGRYEMMPNDTGQYRAPASSGNTWDAAINAVDLRPSHMIEEEARKAESADRARRDRSRTLPEQTRAEENSKAFLANQRAQEEQSKQNSMRMHIGAGPPAYSDPLDGPPMAPPPAYSAHMGTNISAPPGMGMPAGHMMSGGTMSPNMDHNMDSPLCKYRCIMEAILADGKVTDAERSVAEKKRRGLKITEQEHELLLAEFGWTVESYNDGETPGEHICVVCQTEKANHAIVPCGHRCLCGECQKQMISQPCPMCRQRVEKIIRIFDN